MMIDRKSQPRNVTMDAEQWAVVDAISQYHGLGSTSAALRLLVEEYRRLTGQAQRATDAEEIEVIGVPV